MKNRTYEEHLKKWNRARNLVKKHNDKLISKWRSTPWWKFWDRPSFEEQKLIIISNWKEFERLPVPRLSDYFPMPIKRYELLVLIIRTR